MLRNIDIIDQFSVLVAFERKEAKTTYTAYLGELHQPGACELDESFGGAQRARAQSSPSGYGTGAQQKASEDSCVCPHSNKQAVGT